MIGAQGQAAEFASCAEVLLLHAARAPRRKFHALLPQRAVKELLNFQARGALHGARVDRVEDDAGCETFIVTRGAETRRLPNLPALAAWLEGLERHG